MNRSFIGGSGIRNGSLSSSASHRRGTSSINGGGGGGGGILSSSSSSRDSDDNLQLDLFSRSRRSLSIASSDDSEDVSVAARLGRLSLGSKTASASTTTAAAKLSKNPLDDLLASTDGGKHDYDWLLTPPGTPMFPTSDGNESETVGLTTRNSSLARSTSTSTATKTSRLSVSQSSETNNRPRLTRSSSVTRPSLSTSQYSTYSSNKSSSILKTSSASVSSYIRPATPSRSLSTAARPSTPSSRPTLSRSSTPSKSRPTPGTSVSTEKMMRSSQNSRPSTPTSRSQIPATLNTPVSRTTSQPSTPTRRNPAPTSSSIASGPSNSAGRSLQNGRALAAPTSSRPSSPGPRVRPTPQPIVLPDFPLETPPNLRTTLPDRPLSAGRSRPGSAAGSRGNTESHGVVTLQRRNSSPVVTRGRVPESPARNKLFVNGHASHNPESHRGNSDSSMKKPLKTSTDDPGFGRTISKKSLDMAIRHMDIRNGSNGIRPLSSSTLFPQSIRSSGNTAKVQQSPAVSAAEAASYSNGDVAVNNHQGSTATAEHGNFISKYHMENNGNDEEVKKQHLQRLSAKLSVVVDIYESSRYDTLLLKEDLKNTNWLHSVDDKFDDQGALFDNGFEPLPEPFDPL